MTLKENSKADIIFYKHKKITIIVSIFIVLLILYGIYWNVSFSKSKELYYDKQYFEAKDKIDHLLYFGNKIEFEQIICAGDTLQQLENIKETREKEYFTPKEKAELISYDLIDAKHKIRKYNDNKELEDFVGDVIIMYLLYTQQELGTSWSDIDLEEERHIEAERITKEILEHWSK